MLALEDVACPRCRSRQTRRLCEGRDYLYGTPGRFTAVECDTCALGFQSPRPTRTSTGQAYPPSYSPHVGSETALDPALRPEIGELLANGLGYPDVPPCASRRSRSWQKWAATVDLVPRFVHGGRLLEIGAATGGRLRALRAMGWRALSGIEMVEDAAAVARSSGFEVHIGAVEDVITSLPDREYDVVVASFVLEHLHDPFQVVNEVARVLKKNGQFLFSTMTRDSLDAWVWGRYWSGFDFPRHMVYFTMRDLREMVVRDFEWISDARHAAVQDFARPASWRVVERRRLIDRLVSRFVRSAPGAAGTVTEWLARGGITSRISVRCRRR